MQNRAEAPRGITRGFLFADLRDYTAYIESRGDDAGAELLRHYRRLVREAVAQHDGAEIRTEGDSFYVVFPSASSAVGCGLAIVESAAASSPPVRVGVGVHAGESTETDEGYVGSAVNLAARICAQARPGEVLVSDTVRGLVRTRGQVRFASRGSRRLKGIAEPVELFGVTRAAGDAAADVHPRPVVARVGRFVASTFGIASVAVLAVVLIGGAAMVLSAGIDQSGRIDQPTEPTPQQMGAVATPTSAEPSASPSPSATVPLAEQPFPNVSEVELMALVDSAWRTGCDRASASDAPYQIETAARVAPGTTLRPNRIEIPYEGGIECRMGGALPDVLWLWRVPYHHDQYFPIDARGIVVNHAGFLHASNAPCDGETRALESWSFGDRAGVVFCHTNSAGDAVLEWAYDGGDLLGKALRHDGDLPALLAWWREEARFAR